MKNDKRLKAAQIRVCVWCGASHLDPAQLRHKPDCPHAWPPPVEESRPDVASVMLEIAERSGALKHRAQCPATLTALWGPCDCGSERLRARIESLRRTK